VTLTSEFLTPVSVHDELHVTRTTFILI